jgi:hypothetical protein
LPLGDDRAGLDRHALDGVGDVTPLDNDIGVGERGPGVALHDRREAEDVVVASERLVTLVRLPVGVHERRGVGEGGLEVGHDGKRVEVDVDERSGLLRDLGRESSDTGDDLALEPDDVTREQAAVLHHAAVQHVGDIRVRDDREHPRQRACLRRVDPRDARMRMVRVAEGRIDLAGERQVGGVAARARHLLASVRPDERRSGCLEGGHAADPITRAPGLPGDPVGVIGPEAVAQGRGSENATPVDARVR